MIQKISLIQQNKHLINRSTLNNNASKLGLMVLAGAGMSSFNTPNLEPTDMLIPGGLTIKEKAYYVLKGKLPKCVYERWVPYSKDSITQAGDQVVTINKGDGYIGSIITPPHAPDECIGDSFKDPNTGILSDDSGSDFIDTNPFDISDTEDFSF